MTTLGAIRVLNFELPLCMYPWSGVVGAYVALACDAFVLIVFLSTVQCMYRNHVTRTSAQEESGCVQFVHGPALNSCRYMYTLEWISFPLLREPNFRSPLDIQGPFPKHAT